MWEQLAGAALGGLLGGGSSGGQTQTQSRDPWSAAVPWLSANLGLGQNLQKYYQQNPFSEQQKQAYDNSFNMSDRYRQAMPQLMSQMNTGTFDRTNPLSRPQMMQFGNLGFTPTPNPQRWVNPYTTGQIQQAAAPVATPQNASPSDSWMY